eukprot:jgi/Tetstr1/428694/TSEL_018682.t1
MSARTGRPIAEIPLGQTAEARYGAPYLVIHRGDLQQVLLNAAKASAGIDLRLGTRVRHARQNADAVQVEIETEKGNDHLSGGALVGADGVWSNVRRRVMNLRQAVFSGRTAYRAVVPVDRAESWSTPADTSALLARFGSWPSECRDLLSLPDGYLKWALCGMDPGTSWVNGRFALLGDAAHAMLPFAAQGAGMSIEDADALARAIDTTDHLPDALARYQAERQDRAESVLRLARANDRVYHMSGPMALARDTVMKGLGGERLLARLDWLYGWRPPEAR